MKKILLIFLLGIIIIPINTNAATINDNNTYQAKCKSYNVDTSSDTSILDYFYFTYFYNYKNKDTSDFTLIKISSTNHQYSFFIYDNTLSTPLDNLRKISVLPNCFYNGVSGNFTCATSTTQNSFPVPSNSITYKFSTKTLTWNDNNNNSNTLITANTTSSEIEDRYKDYCNIPNVDVNVDFPFDKTDFYCLLVLVGVIIMMLFFKWTFPMKGGRKL